MPTVTCPTCQARYDPGIDGEPDDRADSRSVKVACPACGQWVRLPEREPVNPPDLPEDVLARMAARSTLVGGAGEPRTRRRRREEDEDDRPRRRRRRDSDDEYSRPRRSWGDQERDDYDDDPRGPRPVQGDGLGVASMVVGIVSCVVALPGFCCFLFGAAGVGAGITAVVLGFIGRGHNPASGTAKAGIATGFAGIGLSVTVVLVNVILRFVL